MTTPTTTHTCDCGRPGFLHIASNDGERWICLSCMSDYAPTHEWPKR